MKNIIKVLVIESSNSVSSKLSLESDIEIVSVTNNEISALALIAQHKPNLVAIDFESPNINSIQTIKAIKEYSPETKTFIISHQEGERYITQAIIAGAKGYLLKSTLGKNIIKAIRIMNQGYFQLSLSY